MPFRQQPAFRALIFAAILAAVWIYDALFEGGWDNTLPQVILDLVLFFLLLQASYFFHSQFVLPVRLLQDRLRIWRRLMLHARNRHGPAIFVQNGRKIERRGESVRPGPGLLWIDTASAATTRDQGGPRQVLGPGIHFIDAGERLEGAFSLHTQTYTMGPSADEPIFSKLPEDASEDQRRRHASMQSRRQMVSGLTRDGNEVVPEIRLVFKLDCDPAAPGRPGSRFGFLRESVERAAHGEGVTVDAASARRSHVAWNQLPGLIAADLWREYLGKFTLDELFSAQFQAVPDVLQPDSGATPSSLAPEPAAAHHGWLTRLLWSVNNGLERGLQSHEIGEESPAGAMRDQPPAAMRQLLGRTYTALQIISHMVRARMMQAVVPILDESGRYLKGHTTSEEYKRLRERGIRVVQVHFGSYRFDPAVEEQIVQQWRSAWLTNATTERGHVQQLELLATESGRQQAIIEHAKVLSDALTHEPVTSIPDALRALLRASHDEVLTDEHLHGHGGALLSSLAELSKWVESSAYD